MLRKNVKLNPVIVQVDTSEKLTVANVTLKTGGWIPDFPLQGGRDCDRAEVFNCKDLQEPRNLGIMELYQFQFL